MTAPTVTRVQYVKVSLSNAMEAIVTYTHRPLKGAPRGRPTKAKTKRLESRKNLKRNSSGELPLWRKLLAHILLILAVIVCAMGIAYFEHTAKAHGQPILNAFLDKHLRGIP